MIVKELVAKLGLDVDETAFAKGEALIGGLSRGLLAFGSALVTGLAVGATAIAKSTANAADQAGKLAQKTGVNVETLQELGYAAELADVSMEQLSFALGRLAKSGEKDVAKAFLRVRDQFQALPNDGSRVALLIEKFGRAGAQLAPIFKEGGESIEALMQEARDLGIVFSQEDADAAEEFNDGLTRLSAGLKGLRNDIGRKLFPILHKGVTLLRQGLKAVREWAPALDKVKLAVKGLAIALTSLLLAALIANTGAIASLVTWYGALGVAAVVTAAKSIAAWLAAAAPFVALALLIGLVIGVLEDLYQFLTGGESVIGNFVKYVKDQFGSWRAFFSSLWDWIKSLFNDGVAFAMSKVDELLSALGKLPFGGKLVEVAIRGGLAAASVAGNQSLSGAQSITDSAFQLFGGGSSPEASAAASPGRPIVAPQVGGAKITVNAAAGQNPEEIAGAVNEGMDAWWGAKLQEANAGAE